MQNPIDIITGGSVDSIMSTFTKTLTKLEKLAEKKRLKASKLAATIYDMERTKVTAEDEANRALNVKSKIEGLLA